MSAEADRPNEVGRTIAGRYEVQTVVGGGGMAAVYKVRDTRSDKVVALKRGFLPAKGSHNKRKELLEREFHTLVQLAHPCIIEAYDYGVDVQGPYYTMELLDGADLHGTGRIPWKQACALLRDVASSLALLHSRGLIHRDVSARNVRRTANGRAKLMDFGAMASMGVAKDVVGTPPFLAPEVLQMQALDGRADLFSLGALGYYMLTGTHAFPSRRFRDLRDAWRSRPAPTTKSQPDVPSALNALIMQLLSLERGARPHSASEVMQRLCTIANLPVEEHTQVSRAYLTTPILIGRDRALIAVRRRMLSLVRGDGGTLLIEGPVGSGRSRMLDACALEAKLVGAAVLRADASDERSDWGVVRVLGAQLVQLMPEQAQDAARLSRDVIGQVIDVLRSDGSTSATPADRSLLIRELRDFILSLARTQRLVVVVDDAEQIDEPSAALLAALAHKTERHPLILAVAVNRDGDAIQASASLRFLQLVADRVELELLPADQTETLLRSVFGDVPHLSLIAGRIHALSQGNPHSIMDLAQHLVDRRLAHYEAGIWTLPAQLKDDDLPESLSASLSARLRTLSPDALEICEVLCVSDADNDNLSIADFTQLTTHGQQRRVFRALDELVVARVLVSDTERHRFGQRGFVAVLEGMLEPTRRNWLHSKLADMLARNGGDVLQRADHLLQCSREREALELLNTIDLRQRMAPLQFLERVVHAAAKNELPAKQIHEFRRALLHKAATEAAVDTFNHHGQIVLRELERDSGLVRYRELSNMPEAERLTRALAETQLAYQTLPEHARVSSVPDAVRALASFCGLQRALALSVFDPSLMDCLPSLSPLVPLSPAISLIEMSGEGSAASARGRYRVARDCYKRLLSRVASGDASGLQPAEQTRAVCGAHYVIGLLDAGRGIAATEMHAEALEKERAYQVVAWRVRMLLHLTRGDSEEAARCRRRAELALLREGGAQHYVGTTTWGELLCYALCGDLTGIKQSLETLSYLAARFAGWRPFKIYGEATALRLQGDPAQALELLLPMLERPRAIEHASFAYLAALHVQLLTDLGDIARAAELGRQYVEVSDREGLFPTGHVLHIATGVALAKRGAHQEGVDMVEGVIKIAREDGQSGVCLGSMYEARARIATIMHDNEGFVQYAELCSVEYQTGRNTNLAAKLAHLFEEARAAGVGNPNSSIPLRTALSEPSPNSEYATLHSRMLECADESDRARCALTILLQALDCFAGYLYGVNETDHVLLASLPEDEVDSELADWFADLLAEELEPDASATRRTRNAIEPPLDTTRRAKPGRDKAQVAFRFTDARGRIFEPLFLVKHDNDDQQLAAVLVYHAARDSRRRPGPELLQELADQLLSHGDVTGAMLSSPGTQTLTR